MLFFLPLSRNFFFFTLYNVMFTLDVVAKENLTFVVLLL